ncbi:MAG: MotA/TolQ/ExbB proton channel family protein [Fimbriimonadaceae bacterium]|nr:MotA/TolQ/ExbB proton channel family protein [Fimbriimonadaceae bacterium]
MRIRRIVADLLIGVVTSVVLLVGYGTLVRGLARNELGQIFSGVPLIVAGVCGGFMFVIRHGWGAYLFRLGTVLLIAAAGILSYDNFQLLSEQKVAKDRIEKMGASTTAVETAQIVLVVSERAKARELEHIDWRHRPNPFTRWPLLFGAGAAVVLFIAWRHILGYWWFVFVLAAVLTSGLFAALNNQLLLSDDTDSSFKSSRTLRADYMRVNGYEPNAKLSIEDAKRFLSAKTDLKLELIGEWVQAKKASEGRYDPVSLVVNLTEKTDAELIALLEEKLGVQSRQWPRPANKYLGYNDLSTSTITYRDWAPIVSAVPSNEIIQRMTMSVADPQVLHKKSLDGKAEVARQAEEIVGLPLFTALVRTRMESLNTSTPVGVDRRVNGIIQWVTAFTFFLGGLALMSRRYVHTERPQITADNLLAKISAKAGLAHDDVVALWRELDERRSASGFRDSTEEMLYDACQTLVQTDDRVAAKSAVEAAQGRVADRADSEFAIINYCIWLIPALGFVGTVMGISDAVFEARLLGEGDVMTGLARTMASLGVAFDTTFFALLGSIVLLFASLRIRRQEEQILSSIQTEVLNRVVFAYMPSQPDRSIPPRLSRRLVKSLRRLISQQATLLRALTPALHDKVSTMGNNSTHAATGVGP